MQFYKDAKNVTRKFASMDISSFSEIEEFRITFFIIPVFLFEKVVYRRNLLSMNSIFILTRPFVFLPVGGPSDPDLRGAPRPVPRSDKLGLMSIEPSSSEETFPPPFPPIMSISCKRLDPCWWWGRWPPEAMALGGRE